MSTKNEIDNYFTAQADQVEQERKRAMTEQGFEESFKLPVGTTTITVLKKIPEKKTAKYGEVFIFRILVDGKNRDMMVGIQSPLRREFVERLAGTSTDRVEMTIVRTGQRENTRYSVLD